MNVNVYHRLAQTYYRDKRVDEAVSQYEFILKLNPYNVDAYLELAYLYLNEKKFAECIKILEEAQKHKRHWRATQEVGFLTSEKIDQLRSIKEAQIYIILGLAYAQNEEELKSIAAYEQATVVQPDNGLGYFYLGAMRERRGEREEAYAALKKSVELDAGNPDALNYLGYMYAEDDINLEQAQELINQALEIDPDNGAYLDSLGWVYFKKGMIEQALVQIEMASDIVEDAEILEHLGDIYKLKGENEKAKDAYEQALKLEPERDSVKKKLGKWLIRNSR